MKTSKVFNRVKTVTVSVKFDDGRTIDIKLKKSDLMKAPGLDSIQTVNSVIGQMIGNPIENWVKANPTETELQRDVKKRNR